MAGRGVRSNWGLLHIDQPHAIRPAFPGMGNGTCGGADLSTFLPSCGVALVRVFPDRRKVVNGLRGLQNCPCAQGYGVASRSSAHPGELVMPEHAPLIGLVSSAGCFAVCPVVFCLGMGVQRRPGLPEFAIGVFPDWPESF